MYPSFRSAVDRVGPLNMSPKVFSSLLYLNLQCINVVTRFSFLPLPKKKLKSKQPCLEYALMFVFAVSHLTLILNFVFKICYLGERLK